MSQTSQNLSAKPEQTSADFAKIGSVDSAGMLKAQAKRLRNALASRNLTVSHAGSLELLAQSHGFRDWNTRDCHDAQTRTGSDRRSWYRQTVCRVLSGARVCAGKFAVSPKPRSAVSTGSKSIWIDRLMS